MEGQGSKVREAGIGRAGGYGNRDSPDQSWRVPLNPGDAQAGIKVDLPQDFSYAGGWRAEDSTSMWVSALGLRQDSEGRGAKQALGDRNFPSDPTPCPLPSLDPISFCLYPTPTC